MMKYEKPVMLVEEVPENMVILTSNAGKEWCAVDGCAVEGYQCTLND